EFEHRFTVCTVHQLYNYIGHFGLIIVDETDAFPMSSYRQLLDAVRRAAATPSTIVLMTATPNRDTVDFAGAAHVVTLNRRCPEHARTVVTVVGHCISHAVTTRRLPARFQDPLAGILTRGGSVLVFVREIRMMEKLHPLVA